MSGIYRRRDGTWCVTIELGNVNGKRKRKTFTGRTRKEVVAKRDAYQTGVEMTIATFLHQWMNTTIAENCTQKTYQSYTQMIRLHIEPHIGHVWLNELSPIHIQQMITTLRAKGISPRTVQYAFRILSSALNRAVKWEYITRNVTKLVDTPKIPKHTVDPFTIEQARQFLDTVYGHRLYALYQLAFVLGLRQGELIALQWNDIDWKQRVLHVRHAKTSAGVRSLSIPAPLLQTLHYHYEQQQHEHHTNEHGLVFPSSVGTPLSARNLLRHYKQTLAIAGLPNRRFHDLRHSCASFLIANGEHPRVVMEVLGHSQIAVTMNTYAHVLSDVQEAAVAGVAATLLDKPKG
jgi:integrase